MPKLRYSTKKTPLVALNATFSAYWKDVSFQLIVQRCSFTAPFTLVAHPIILGRPGWALRPLRFQIPTQRLTSLYRRSPGCHRLESPNGRLALHFLAVRSRTFAEMKVVLVVNIAVELTVRYAPKRWYVVPKVAFRPSFPCDSLHRSKHLGSFSP